MKEKIINIPNAVTLIRLILIVPFVYLLFIGNKLAALTVFLAAVLSDKLDGTLARSLKQETQFGKTFDAAADSTLMISAFSSIYFLNYINLYLALLIAAPRIFTAILFYIPSKLKFFTTIYSRVAALFIYITIVFILLDTKTVTYGLIVGIYILSIIHWHEIIKTRMKH